MDVKDFDLYIKKVASDIKTSLTGNVKDQFSITYGIPTTGCSAVCRKKKDDNFNDKDPNIP